MILYTKQLSKQFGQLRAVDQLSLQIEKGMVYGMLGPNGSGKTTTLGMVLGIIHPTSGSYEWFEGQRGRNPRRHLGTLLETPNFYPYLSATDNLKIVAEIKRIQNPDIDHALDLVNLLHRKRSKFKTYSLGMKQRLAIAAAMIGDPDVLIFDEPTNGLDPQGIAEVRETIKEIAQTGKTIIMASHILDEVEKICSHVAIIKNGHLLATGPVGAIINDDILIEIGSEDKAGLRAFLPSLPQLNKLEETEFGFLIYLQEEMSTAALNQKAFEKGIVINHLRRKQKSLEAEFLEITNQNLSQTNLR